jgi:hypothetical protein
MLLDLRYAAVDVELILKIYRAQLKPPTLPEPKEASKADIVAGVKRGVITPEEGYVMLIHLGFLPEAATFILSLIPSASALSPATFAEFQDQTQRYRLAAGIGGKPVSEEIKRAGAQLVKLNAEVAALDRAVKTEQATLATGEGLPPEATARLKELQVSRNHALAELHRVQVEYDALVADWKHAGK